MNPKIIGEIGVNHNGSTSIAKKLISELADLGADFAKIQVFNPNLLVTRSAGLANYQLLNGVRDSSQFEMLNTLTLRFPEIVELQGHADQRGIALLTTVFDLESLDFVTEKLGHNYLKISSGDLTFHRLLWRASKSKAHLFVSTGMSTLKEVQSAVNVIRFGRAQRTGIIPMSSCPTSTNIEKYSSELAQLSNLDLSLTLLHCTSSYPAPAHELNISALESLKGFGCDIGYSDHSLSDIGAILATGFGARVFEKHITLDKSAEGPDHAASLTPNEFSNYVQAIREASEALGTGEKVPQPSELNVRQVARRGLYASQDIRAGSQLELDMLLELRPENGVSASKVFDYALQVAPRKFRAGEGID